MIDVKAVENILRNVPSWEPGDNKPREIKPEPGDIKPEPGDIKPEIGDIKPEPGESDVDDTKPVLLRTSKFSFLLVLSIFPIFKVRKHKKSVAIC